MHVVLTRLDWCMLVVGCRLECVEHLGSRREPWHEYTLVRS